MLAQVTWFATKESWSEKGGEAVKAPGKWCLVLSRPCVAAHKKYLTVAGIAKSPDTTPKDLDGFEKMLAFLTEMRDGLGSPDLFYLGQLPTLQGRYCATTGQLAGSPSSSTGSRQRSRRATGGGCSSPSFTAFAARRLTLTETAGSLTLRRVASASGFRHESDGVIATPDSTVHLELKHLSEDRGKNELLVFNQKES